MGFTKKMLGVASTTTFYGAMALACGWTSGRLISFINIAEATLPFAYITSAIGATGLTWIGIKNPQTYFLREGKFGGILGAVLAFAIYAYAIYFFTAATLRSQGVSIPLLPPLLKL